MLTGLLACASAGPMLLAGGTVVGGGRSDVLLRDGRIAALGTDLPPPDDAVVVDVRGKWIAPAFVDAHVHLAYLPMADAMADGGVAAVVDLGAPLSFRRPEVPRVLWSGPFLVAPGGYPSTSWGRDGYGLPCDASTVRDVVRRVAGAGASVVKTSLGMGPDLDEPALLALVDEAHRLGSKTAVHALDDASAARGAAMGFDLLAHTPVEPLSDATVAAWAGRGVISTLGAFGGGPVVVDNLRRLRAAGATVLYGTDFGNTRRAGIDPHELQLLVDAGLDGRAVLDAGTTSPAGVFGLDDLGEVRVGAEASVLVLRRDPLVDPSVLASPDLVVVRGVERSRPAR